MTREGTYNCPHCGVEYEIDDDTFPMDGDPRWPDKCVECGETFWCRVEKLTLHITTEK